MSGPGSASEVQSLSFLLPGSIFLADTLSDLNDEDTLAVLVVASLDHLGLERAHHPRDEEGREISPIRLHRIERTEGVALPNSWWTEIHLHFIVATRGNRAFHRDLRERMSAYVSLRLHNLPHVEALRLAREGRDAWRAHIVGEGGIP